MRFLLTFLLLCSCVGPLICAQAPQTPPPAPQPPAPTPEAYLKTPPPPSPAERKKLCICGKPLDKGEKKQKVDITTKDGKKHGYSVCSDECAKFLGVMAPDTAVNLMQEWLNPTPPPRKFEPPKPPQTPQK